MDLNQIIEMAVQKKIREYLDAPDCKSVYTGSIPVLASNIKDLEEPGSRERDQLSADFHLKAQNLITEYVSDHLRNLKTGNEREKQLRRFFRIIGDRSLPGITQRDLTQALNRWSGPTQNRYRSALTHFYRWARAHGYTTMTPTFLGAKENPRDHVLTLDQVRRLYKAAERRGPWGAYAKVLILSAQRRGDVMGMLPAHIDLKSMQWNQPTSKNGMPHIVPLTPRMKKIILNEWEGEGFTWTGKTTFSDFKRRWFTDARVPLSFRLHDLRRAFATHMAEAGWSPDVIDRHLNHVASASSRGVARVYNRAQMLNERRKLVAAWDDLLFDPLQSE